FALSDLAERHVVPDDLALVAVFVGDHVQRDMRVVGLLVVVELYVLELGPADHQLLLGDRHRVPSSYVVHILLHDHVTATDEFGILVADEHGGLRERAVGILGAVDETQQVAVVEEPEAVHLVDDSDRAHRADDSARELEADVHALGPDVKQQIAGCGRGDVSRPAQFVERVQLSRTRPTEQPVPRRRPDGGHHRQVLGRVAKPDRTHHPGQFGQRIVHDGLAAFVDGGDQENGRGRQRRQDGLRLSRGHEIDPSRDRAGCSSEDGHMSQASANGLCEFIDASPSPYHVCATVAARLTASGYTKVAEGDRWQADGRYFTLRAGSVVAWNSTGPPGRPFRVVGAHTDSPNLRVKQHPDRFVSGWQVVALQPYGGAWLNSWLDRDLGI